MDEKIMVNDILSNTKSKLTEFGIIISETENIELRQTLKKMRDDYESFQYELFKVAEQKGYYKFAQVATIIDIQTVKNELQ